MFKKKKEKPEAVKKYEELLKENKQLLNSLLNDIEGRKNNE